MTISHVVDELMTVRSALAPLLSEPRAASALTSQLLAGEVVRVSARRGDWLRVQGHDGYEGWTHRGFVTRHLGTELTWLSSMGCRVRTNDGTVRSLPFGARVAPGAALLDGATVDLTTRAMRFPKTASAIAASATVLFEGASYLWGGITPWGCDCSGFVQRIFVWHGVQLPRDAWQQALHGTRSAHTADAVHAPGDLLFFSDRDDRRVTHVGIALEGARMIHSSLARGGVAIEALTGSDPYVERLRAECVEARRYL